MAEEHTTSQSSPVTVRANASDGASPQWTPMGPAAVAMTFIGVAITIAAICNLANSVAEHQRDLVGIALSLPGHIALIGAGICLAFRAKRSVKARRVGGAESRGEAAVQAPPTAAQIGAPHAKIVSPSQPVDRVHEPKSSPTTTPTPAAVDSDSAIFSLWTEAQPVGDDSKAAQSTATAQQPTTIAGATHRRMPVWPVAFGLLAIALAVGYGLLASGANASRSTLSPDAIFTNCSPAVAQVEIQDRNGQTIGAGSGFLVGHDGLIATNYYVIEKAHTAHVIFPDRTLVPVDGVAALDEEADIAILRVTGRIGAQPLELADGELPSVGAKVYAIGNPLGQFANTLSDGLVSAHREGGTIPKFPKMPAMIQTTAPISHGSSGGPLFNADGKVVGVMTLTWEDVGGHNVNLAVPASHVARLLHRCGAGRALTRLPMVREPDASDFIKSGRAWVEKGEYDKAITDYNEAIRLRPEGASAFYNRGYAWSLKKDYDRAISDYDQAIRFDTTEAVHFSFRGNAWAGKKEYDRAVADYNQAIRLDPKDAFAHFCRGNAWAETKDYDRAIADMAAAVRLDQQSAAPSRMYESSLALAYFDRATSQFPKLGINGPSDSNLRKAISDYSEAIRFDPDNAGYHFWRGSARLSLGRYDSAMQDFDQAIRLDPNDHLAYGGRANVWLAKKEYEKAIWDCNQAIRLEPTYALYYSYRG